MQEAMDYDPRKAFGQDVLQDKPRELVALEGAVEPFAGAALDAFEGDLAVLTVCLPLF